MSPGTRKYKPDIEPLNFIPASPPITIHTYHVRAAVQLPETKGSRKGLFMVLVDRGANTQGSQRYVVALWALGDNEWMSGFYTDDYKLALDNLYTRAMSNLPNYEIGD